METKEKIIISAYKLFLQRGYWETSLNMIAKEVGISKPAIYHYFDSRDHLAYEVAEYFFNKLGEWSLGEVSKAKGEKEILFSFFNSFQIFSDPSKFIIDDVFDKKYSTDEFFMQTSKQSDQFKLKIVEAMKGTRVFIGSLFRKLQNDGVINPALNPDHLAIQLHCMVEGATHVSLITRELNSESEWKAVFDTFWSSIEIKS